MARLGYTTTGTFRRILFIFLSIRSLARSFSPAFQITHSPSQLNMGPPLPPSQCGSCITSTSRTNIQIECFLDLICPFSCKMFTTLYNGVLPALKDDSGVSIIFHHVVQPWHPQGTAPPAAAPSRQAPYVERLRKKGHKVLSLPKAVDVHPIPALLCRHSSFQ